MTDITVDAERDHRAGSGSTRRATTGKNDQYTAKATDIARRHQIRYGVPVRGRRIRPDQPAHGPDVHRAGRAADGDRREVNILPEITDFGQIYRVTRANFNSGARPRSRTTRASSCRTRGRVGDRLTIKPGIRYEQQTLVGTIVDRLLR